MLPIICIVAFCGALVGQILILRVYFKGGSALVPFIIFFAFIAIFGVSVFFTVREDKATANESPDTPSQSIAPDIETEKPSLSSDAETSSLPEPSKEPTPAETPNAGLLSIGDNATLGDWEISVTDFYYTDRIETSPYTYFHPDEGNQYAVVNVRVTNNGTEMDTFLPPINMGSDVWAELYYANKYRYSPSFLPGVDEDLSSETINPLITKDGIVAFAVPAVVVNSEDSLSVIFSIGQNEVTFSLR